MSPTLLEFIVAIILVVVLWQIGVIIAPSVLGWLGRLGHGVDEAAERATRTDDDQQTKEHHNGTHR
ncbi:hypothetical protein SE17_29855 [Kouleothrix aurantiaca]|jgi:hypothetical protein|uniref:Uncharacterized protein n=1 Tax=Kouleothrix aurantiaca TaxID=186479 RepID=A0A0P9FBH5_9CHLR|nr:hypothetical protein SE17_29855 [Kouleothrix aurantiaca]